MKKFATMVTSVALIGAMVAGGSLAYLSDTDSAVNVMTLGKVEIEQIEQERNADGKLVDFTQAKPAYPAVGEVKWDDTKLTVNEVAYNVYDDGLKNVVDKIVTVKNTGKSDAYVRTLIAIEQPEGTDNLVHVNMNTDRVTSAELGAVVINGTRYAVTSHTYDAALAPKAISAPSLMQLFLDKAADNKDCEKFGDTWDVLVLSQAVQTAGFDTAATALNEAFGELNEMNVKEWFGAPVIPTVYEVSTNEELKAALTANDNAIVVTLNADVAYDVDAWDNNAMGGSNTQEILIEGHGHTITFNQTNSDWNNIVTNGAKLVIKDAKITNSGHNNGPWNRHDLNFACDVELSNVTSDKAFAFKAGATLKNVTINDANTSDTYAIWIQPNGQTVTLDNVTIDMINCTDGRGIKIDEQYVTAPEKVTLIVKDTEFKTEEKSAILVKSVAGADITLNNVDIAGVAADTVNAVWVDEASADYADKVNVKGGSVKVEGTVAVATAGELAEKLAAGESVYLTADIKNVDADNTITIAAGKNATLNLNGHKITSAADGTSNRELFLVKGNLKVVNGSIELTATQNQGWNAMATVFDVTAGGVLNLDGVKAKVSGTDMNFIVHLNNWGEATLNVNDCDFTASYVAVRAFNSGHDMNNVTIKNTDFHKGRVFWVHNYTSEGKDDSTLNLDIYGNGNTTDNAKPVRFGFSNEVYYDINGNVIN